MYTQSSFKKTSTTPAPLIQLSALIASPFLTRVVGREGRIEVKHWTTLSSRINNLGCNCERDKGEGEVK